MNILKVILSLKYKHYQKHGLKRNLVPYNFDRWLLYSYSDNYHWGEPEVGERECNELRKERDAYYDRLQELRAELAKKDEEEGKALLYCADKTATRVAKELIEKFKDWLFDNAPHSVWEEFVDTHAFEGIIGNKKEIPSNLTWQDIKRIVEIADDILDFQKMGFLATEDYGWSSEEAYYTKVLLRFKEESK